MKFGKLEIPEYCVVVICVMIVAVFCVKFLSNTIIAEEKTKQLTIQREILEKTSEIENDTSNE